MFFFDLLITQSIVHFVHIMHYFATLTGKKFLSFTFHVFLLPLHRVNIIHLIRSNPHSLPCRAHLEFCNGISFTIILSRIPINTGNCMVQFNASLPVKYIMEYTHLSFSFQWWGCGNCHLSQPQDWTTAVRLRGNTSGNTHFFEAPFHSTFFKIVLHNQKIILTLSGIMELVLYSYFYHEFYTTCIYMFSGSQRLKRHCLLKRFILLSSSTNGFL